MGWGASVHLTRRLEVGSNLWVRGVWGATIYGDFDTRIDHFVSRISEFATQMTYIGAIRDGLARKWNTYLKY